MKLLELNNVTVSFPSPDGTLLTALVGLDLSVNKGELVALVGRYSAVRTYSDTNSAASRAWT